MSNKAPIETSSVRIVTVLGTAAIALFASLLAALWAGSLEKAPAITPAQPSPLEKSHQAFIAKKTKELPEVQTFLRLHPDATEREYYNTGSAAQYSFNSTIPSVRIANGFIQWIELIIYVDSIPAPQGMTQYQHQRQIGDFYFGPVFACGPYSVAHPDESWFPAWMWEKSKYLCPSEMTELNSTYVQLLNP